MSRQKSGFRAFGGLVLGTTLFILVIAAIGWVYATYHFGEERKKAYERIVTSMAWEPTRVARADATADCDAGRMREESALRQSEVSAFDLSKMNGFNQSASSTRARGLGRILKTVRQSNLAFMEAYTCAKNSRLPRDGSEQQLSGVTSANAIAVKTWLDSEEIPEILKVVWIARDIQATAGLYEFEEGVKVMDTAYVTLRDHLHSGKLDPYLDAVGSTLDQMIANEESAQLQWQVGARGLLANLYGEEWDRNPPNPGRAYAMIEGVDALVDGLNAMPNVASQPYPERKKLMTDWLKTNDMTEWDGRFAGFGKAGLQVDALATRTHALGRALRIGVALREFRKKRGYCPRDLGDLERLEVLMPVPPDPIANAPFTYDSRACSVTSAPIEPGGAVEVWAIPPKDD